MIPVVGALVQTRHLPPGGREEMEAALKKHHVTLTSKPELPSEGDTLQIVQSAKQAGRECEFYIQ
jgi:hypothetical protein